MKLSVYEIKAISTWSKGTLDLRNKNLTDQDLEEMCSALEENKAVTCLLLDHNRITSKGVFSLVKKLLHVERIGLAYNDLDDSCLLQLAKSHFKSFDLSWNNITNDGVELLIQNSNQESITVDALKVNREKQQALSDKLRQKKKNRLETEQKGTSDLLTTELHTKKGLKEKEKGEADLKTSSAVPPAIVFSPGKQIRMDAFIANETQYEADQESAKREQERIYCEGLSREIAEIERQMEDAREKAKKALRELEQHKQRLSGAYGQLYHGQEERLLFLSGSSTLPSEKKDAQKLS